ncbi:uncharacterized protein LOC114522281 [Dendronephthya gigantea]|uniref:uncharacterized protein LOC114522281 n=1 Tax=Dendronephthya gigantea TaxID=151771 RepID=UPI001069114C|nr:uncharacterized protein LOC114522281 [Dendronephthya gigantea]
MPDEFVDLELQWKSRLEKNFNVFTVGKIFNLSNDHLVVGGEDGIIRIYDLPTMKHSAEEITLKELIKLETKGGPVQILCLHNITKFGSVDLIVADTKGTLTFFGNKQILYKMAISEGCISALTVDIDAAQNLSIVLGDHEGNVVGCLPHCTQWKLRLSDLISSNKNSSEAMVTSLLSIKLPVSPSLVSNYVLVADSHKNLYVLQNGNVVRTLDMPSTVSTMCVGYFLDGLDTNTPLSPHSSVTTRTGTPHQVALGMIDGRIFILNNFSLTLYANIKLSLTKIVACSLGKTMDTLLCCGYFNSMLVYHNGKRLHKVRTDDWVSSIKVVPSRGKHEHCVYLGTLDGTIQSYGMSMLAR